MDPLMKSKLGLLWSERQDPMDPFQVGEEKVFEFMQNNDQSSSKSAEPPQVVRDAVKMAWRNRGSCRYVACNGQQFRDQSQFLLYSKMVLP